MTLQLDLPLCVFLPCLISLLLPDCAHLLPINLCINSLRFLLSCVSL